MSVPTAGMSDVRLQPLPKASSMTGSNARAGMSDVRL